MLPSQESGSCTASSPVPPGIVNTSLLVLLVLVLLQLQLQLLLLWQCHYLAVPPPGEQCGSHGL
jgi:hypothetical protein